MTRDEFSTWLRTDRQTRRPLTMGVINVTPDSFSDGGHLPTVDAVVAKAEEMAGQGADLLDIGGESTRPGSVSVTEEEQIRRVIPAISAIRQVLPIAISIDTTRCSVASAALDSGANLVNDISGGAADPGMLRLVALKKVPIVLMHMRGKPLDMQENPEYLDLIGEVMQFLGQRVEIARNFGVDPADILIDPGIGFGKTVSHNLQLLKHLGEFSKIGPALVIGTSRKGFIAKVTGETDPRDRVFGTAGTVAWAVAHGADIVRVHDVEPMVRVVRMVHAIRTADEASGD